MRRNSQLRRAIGVSLGALLAFCFLFFLPGKVRAAVSSGGSTFSFPGSAKPLSPSAPAPPAKPASPSKPLKEPKLMPLGAQIAPPTVKPGPKLSIPKPVAKPQPAKPASPKPPVMKPPAKPTPVKPPAPTPQSFPSTPPPSGLPRITPGLPPLGRLPLTGSQPGLPPPLPDMTLLDFKPGLGALLGWGTVEAPFPEALSNQAVLEADKVEHRKTVGDIRAEGDAQFRYRELSLSAPLLYFHESRELVSAKDHALLLFRGHRLEAEDLYVDFREKSLKARGDVLLFKKEPTLSASAEADEEAIVTSLKKRSTTLTAKALDVTWEKNQEDLSASGNVVVEQPKWRMVSDLLRANNTTETLTAVGHVVLKLSDSRWLMEDDVMQSTNLTEALADLPITVTTPQIDFDNKKGIAYLHGPALVEQPDKRLRARSITVNDKEDTVLFDGFEYNQDESMWLIEHGVIASLPERVEADMDKPLTAMSATALYHRGTKRLEMDGDVNIRQGTQWIKADRLTWDEGTRTLELIGDAEVHDETTKEFLQGTTLVYKESTGRFEAAGAVRIKVKLEEDLTP